MSSKKGSNNSRSQKGGDFRPQRMLPPTLATSQGEYAQYLAAYKLYVESLAAFKSDFWRSVKSEKVPTGEFRSLERATFGDQKGRKVHATRVEIGPGVYIGSADASFVDGRWVDKTGSAKKFAPPEGFTFLQAEDILLVEPGSRDHKKSVAAKAPVVSAEEKKARKAAKRKRNRLSRRQRELKTANVVASELGKLAAQNKNLAGMAKKSGDSSWTLVTRKGGLRDKKVPKKERRSAGKAKVQHGVTATRADVGSSQGVAVLSPPTMEARESYIRENFVLRDGGVLLPAGDSEATPFEDVAYLGMWLGPDVTKMKMESSRRIARSLAVSQLT